MAEFRFHDNWREFVEKYFSEERVTEAKHSLTEFYGVDDFRRRSFLDIGCGSGLFSFAAYELGAEEIISFDVNPGVAEATREVRAHAGNPDRWTVKTGDILDEAFVEELGAFDLVYSWGVLHHTGAMFDAIENSLDCVAPGGRYYLAVANDGSKAGLSSAKWATVKRVYNSSPTPIKRLLEAGYIGGFIAHCVVNGENPVRKIREFRKRRGMAFYPDVKDWLGATPFEFARPNEVIHMVTEGTDFHLKRLRRAPDRVDTSGTGCNEFLFERQV